MIKKQYPVIKKSLWKSAFWKTGYFYYNNQWSKIFDTIRQYIERQLEK